MSIQEDPLSDPDFDLWWEKHAAFWLECQTEDEERDSSLWGAPWWNEYSVRTLARAAWDKAKEAKP